MKTNRLLWLMLLGALVGLLPGLATAQVPSWETALATAGNSGNGTAVARATAIDASTGAVYVAGYFSGQVQFGPTVLNSRAGLDDAFVARWLPATGTWAWALAGGGTAEDQALGVAATGGAVYVAGYITNDQADADGTSNVQFGSRPLPGASATSSRDAFVARLTDPGNAAPTDWAWALAAGGTGTDQGYAVAAEGGAVYVAGYFANDQADANGSQNVQFGSRPLPGASSTNGQDAFVARVTDPGSAAPTDWAWALGAGGTGIDQATGVAVQGGAVYVVGALANNNADTNGSNDVQFGSRPLRGASSTNGQDAFVARVTDPGSTVPTDWAWALAAGGIGDDRAQAVAVQGSAVYVGGYIVNNNVGTSGSYSVRFGTLPLLGATASISIDAFVARVTDPGSAAPTTWAWALSGGGTNFDQVLGVAVSGGAVYVAGGSQNDNADADGSSNVRFGSVLLPGASATRDWDAVVARVTEPSGGGTPTWAWALNGGGTSADQAYGVAVQGGAVYVAAYVSGTVDQARFGTAAGSPLAGSSGRFPLLGAVADAGASAGWQRVSAARVQVGTALALGSAVEAGTGAVYVAGSFTGQVEFGTTLLTSRGASDAFVARWLPATSTWAWALAAGGTGNDQAASVAVQGGAVYVAGQIDNDNADANGSRNVQFGSLPLAGASSTSSLDVFVARLTDPGSSAPTDWAWALAAGGTLGDQATGVAVQGGAVYVVGGIQNDNLDANGSRDVQFGTHPLPGASSTTNGSFDVFVARVTDPGPTAPTDWAWALAAGGTGNDLAHQVVVRADAVYVAGSFFNDNLDANGSNDVQFGSQPVAGASSTASIDGFVARLTDPGAGAPGTWAWVLPAGGTGEDRALALRPTDGGLYVAGTFTNDQADPNGSRDVQFGSHPLPGSGPTPNFNAFVARLDEPGGSASPGWNWVLGAGGTGDDRAVGLAVQDRAVYVVGTFFNDNLDANGSNDMQFGTLPLAGTSASGGYDAFVARLTAPGSGAPGAWAWALAAGGAGVDRGQTLAAAGGRLLVAGWLTGTASFGSTSLPTTSTSQRAFVASVLDPLPLPVELTSFTATAAGPGAARLAWATATEINSALFAIERSPDGQAWQELGRVAAAGRSASPRPYAYLDPARPAGPSYYRLRQVDLDGTYSYSPVRVVAGTAPAAPGLLLWPNPAHGAVAVAGLPVGAAVAVLDALGRPVARATADASGTAQLTLPAGTSAGVYVVRAGATALRLTVE